MTAPHLSPFQFTQQLDGSMSLGDFPHVTLNTVEGQGSVVGRDWQTELGMPTYYEEWEALARVRSDEHRGCMSSF